MSTILGAVKAKFTDALANSFTNLWYDKAPDDKKRDWPYLVFRTSKPGSDLASELTFGGGDVTRDLIYFEVFAEKLSVCETLSLAVRDAYHRATLSLTDGTFLSLLKLHDPYYDDTGLRSATDYVYRGTIAFEYAIQH